MDVGVGAGVLVGVAVGGVGQDERVVSGAGAELGKAVGSHATAGADGLVGTAVGGAGVLVGTAVGGAGVAVGTVVGVGATAAVGIAVSAAAIDSDAVGGGAAFSQATAARTSTIAVKISAKARGSMRLCP